jgi:hypothetical protein
MVRWPWTSPETGGDIVPCHPNYMMAHEKPGVEPKAVRPDGSNYYVTKSFVSDELFNAPHALGKHSLRRCRLLPDRVELLKHLPRRARVAELGTYYGSFAKQILETCAPIELALFDLTFHLLDAAYFAPHIELGRVRLHEGDSSTLLRTFPDEHFDWIYIDGDHSFEGVSKDIAVAKTKIKRNGLLVFNDYTVFSPLERCQYGVQRAVNDLCLNDDFEILFFALHVLGYHDVCLRRRPRGALGFVRRLGGDLLHALGRAV